MASAIVSFGSVRHLGTRTAQFAPCGEGDADFTARLASVLAENDDALLASFVDDETSLPYASLRAELVTQPTRGTLTLNRATGDVVRRIDNLEPGSWTQDTPSC